MIYLKIDVRDSYRYPVKNGDNWVKEAAHRARQRAGAYMREKFNSIAISTVYAFVSMAVESLRDGLLGKQRRN
ncbi:conserved hypothetical protein [Vibrio chagasii]|nr:conserved hypothetical protein [Vibrio chagasii]CAH7254773.1 conserved hypothetical protein [Vibrio chagasii]